MGLTLGSNMNTPSDSRTKKLTSLLRQFWRSGFGTADAAPLAPTGVARKSASWVPIRSLSPRHKPRIARQLRALPNADRYLRFGYAATDEQIERYVQGLNFERDEIFGVFNRRLELVAMAHLAYSVDPKWATCAEFGVSVSPHQRGKGLGAKLFAHAVMHARNQGVNLLFIHALSENTAMLNIALNGLMQEQMAELDYQLKMQAHQFRQWLDTVQEIRRGVRDARHSTRGP